MERQRHRVAREGERGEEPDEHERPQLVARERLRHVTEVEQGSCRAVLGGERLAQDRAGGEEVDDGERRSDQPRREGAEVVAGEPADQRAQDEPDPERRADQAHPASPLRRRRDVRDVRLRRRDVAARKARDHAGDEQHRVGRGEREQRIARRVDEHRGEQDRPAAHPIREPAEQRRRQELHRREDEHEGAVPDPMRAEALGVHGQDRQHDAEADQVDQDRDEDDRQARAAGRHGALTGHRGRAPSIWQA